MNDFYVKYEPTNFYEIKKNIELKKKNKIPNKQTQKKITRKRKKIKNKTDKMKILKSNSYAFFVDITRTRNIQLQIS